MKISLIMGTLGGREDRIAVFLDALSASTHDQVELLIVDQSGRDSSLSRILQQPRRFPIVHLWSEPGLSRARNLGIARSSGDLLAFPDDDCWYPPGLLASVESRFDADQSLGGLAGRPVDADGRSSFPRWDLRAGPVNRFNVWRRCNSNALFLRRAAVERIGGFDESLGLGAGSPWGAAEDIDYPLRLLATGIPIEYDPTILVQHPLVVLRYDAASTARAGSYARGMGRVLRKHCYPRWFVLYQQARPLAGALISAGSGRLTKARYHWAIFQGRRQGWATEY